MQNSACKVIARRRQLAAKMRRGSSVYAQSLQIGYPRANNVLGTLSPECRRARRNVRTAESGTARRRRQELRAATPGSEHTRPSKKKALETTLDTTRGLHDVARKPPTDVALPRRRHGEITAEITNNRPIQALKPSTQNVDRRGLR